MPQLKKIVIAVGNRLVYEDTYDQALASLSGASVAQRALPGETMPAPQLTSDGKAAPVVPALPASARDTVILDHLQKLRREIDALETELKKVPRK